ncbi:hypothetical protein Francci3_2265 [Frankia casuarinae]|uniref:Uncharacterized protein n=1 Tax=Frankia casuarinae (strain DSM 45818 / CECT 9043 / HFP020203 / CcI3) TaxID=106370 RepID=Q2JAQ9_FRACC|nr:hypothetical protein Francci3_2265 [Frankia casuarinae]
MAAGGDVVEEVAVAVGSAVGIEPGAGGDPLVGDGGVDGAADDSHVGVGGERFQMGVQSRSWNAASATTVTPAYARPPRTASAYHCAQLCTVQQRTS